VEDWLAVAKGESTGWGKKIVKKIKRTYLIKREFLVALNVVEALRSCFVDGFLTLVDGFEEPYFKKKGQVLI